jgi:hypothetical protein
MNGLSRLQRLSFAGVTGLLLGGGMLGFPWSAIAQGTIQLRLPNISAPGNRESGSTRSTSCISPTDDLIALVPATNFGLTEQPYPTFYFYLPPTDARQVKFVMLNDETNELIYEGRFSIQGNSGIVSVTLPDNGLQQPLAIDQTYVWYLAVVCDVMDPSADIVVEGYVGRVSPLAIEEGTPPATLPMLYADAGLWYDALAASANLKTNNVSTIEWNTLLDAVDLNQLIPLPLLSTEVTPINLEPTASQIR